MIFIKTDMKINPKNWRECKEFRKYCKYEHVCIDCFEIDSNTKYTDCPLGSVTHEQITDIIKGWLNFNHTPEQLADQIMFEIEEGK